MAWDDWCQFLYVVVESMWVSALRPVVRRPGGALPLLHEEAPFRGGSLFPSALSERILDPLGCPSYESFTRIGDTERLSSFRLSEEPVQQLLSA